MRTTLLVITFLILMAVSTKEVLAIGLLLPFGGRVLNISPNLDFACPVGPQIITVGPPRPFTAIFTNAPFLVRNGPTKTGAWVIGLASPPVPPCLPIVFIMGTSKGGIGLF